MSECTVFVEVDWRNAARKNSAAVVRLSQMAPLPDEIIRRDLARARQLNSKLVQTVPVIGVSVNGLFRVVG